ncbi:MAG: putative modified peptide [Candidatus Dadabacteria bacterium]|nr:MAG: putative modified peptide [Candidatus Dadabacteria bacterium]
MSQCAVEAAMGRLICDDAFRAAFRKDPEAALARAGLKLTAIEFASLRKVSLTSIERLASVLDGRIRRAGEEADFG